MTIKNKIINLIGKLPYISRLRRENILLRNEKWMQRKNSMFPDGHYHSTINSIDHLKTREALVWGREKESRIAGINLNTSMQLHLIDQFIPYYHDIPFPSFKNNLTRYYFENEFHSYTDAIFLYSMMRHFNPKQIIEVGSGYSAAVILDTNERFFDNRIRLTIIEPHPDRLYSLIAVKDRNSSKVIEQEVQQIPLEIFELLEAGDILFIDSSHVVKTGSDVNYILFEILPRLKSGVLIHFHDIFYPFDYPKEVVYTGIQWNEGFFLRAFLMYNNEFEIKLFSNYLYHHHIEVYDKMPLCHKNTGGNLWLTKK